MHLPFTILTLVKPTEQFWSVVKSSAIKEFIVKKDTIPQIIADTRNQAAQLSFESFARYLVKCYDDCLTDCPI
jgi:hypothetical protein